MEFTRRRALGIASPAVAAAVAAACTPTSPTPGPTTTVPDGTVATHQLVLSDFAPEGGVESARQGLQDALAQLRDAGGGELLVDGLFLIDGWGVDVAMDLDQLNFVTIRGAGGYCGFVLRGDDPERVMLNLGRIVSLRLVDLVFYGSAEFNTASPQTLRPDFKKGLYLWDCASVSVDRCLFVGLVGNTVAETSSWDLGAVIHAERAPLYLRDTLFLGCGGTIAGWGAAHDTPVVRSAAFTSFVAENCRWMDVYDGGWLGEPQRFRRHPSAHVLLQDPWTPDGGMRGHNVRGAVLRNCHFDEAAACAIEVGPHPGGARMRQLMVDTCSIASASAVMNTTGRRKAAPLLVRAVDDVKVVSSFFGDYGSHPVAMRFEGCDHVLVDGATGAAPVTTVQADAGCNTLVHRSLRGSLSIVDSAAQRTVDLEQLYGGGAPPAQAATAPVASSGAPLLPEPLSFATMPRTPAIRDLAVLVPGRLHLAAIELPEGLAIQRITFFSGQEGLATASHLWFALFDASGELLAVTTDDAGVGWAPGSAKTLATTTTHVTGGGGIHYLGIVVAGGSVPSLLGVESDAAVAALPPVLAGTGADGLGPPPSGALTSPVVASPLVPLAGVS
jgi:hypothetical protein